jgi:hypothetical protein
METSTAGVVGFLERNDSLIKQLMETAESAHQEITDLSVQVDHAREEAKVLVDQLGAVEFSVGKHDETKVRQKAILEAVAVLRKKFETYKNDPLRRGIYAAEISNLYVQLANTFNNETIAQIVPFSRDEIKSFRAHEGGRARCGLAKETSRRYQGCRTDLQTGLGNCREVGGVSRCGIPYAYANLVRLIFFC